MNKLVIIYAFFLFFTASPAYSLFCYEGLEKKGDITLSLLKVVDCDEVLPTKDAIYCAKAEILGSDGKLYFGRGCLSPSDSCENRLKKGLELVKDIFIDEVKCETCSSDKCNSSFDIRPSSATIVVISVLTAFLKISDLSSI